MKTTIISIIVLIILSSIITNIILAESLEGKMEVIDDKKYLSTAEADRQGISVDPNYDYYNSYRLKKKYYKTSFITWDCKIDTLSKATMQEVKTHL